jgi:uncharacterized FlaG/YvyC family protein
MSEEQTDAIGSIGALNSTDFNSVHDAPIFAAPQKSPAADAVRSDTTAAPASNYGTTAAAPRSTQPTTQEVTAAVGTANANLSNYGRVVDYRTDPATGISIATIRDSQTRAVLQQIPTTDMLHMAQLLADWAPGKNLQLDLLA